MTQLADLGVFGLSTMGGNLARNAARKGFGVALFNRHVARTDELIAEHGAEGRFVAAKSVAEFAGALAKPRAILIMVQAGKPVDDVIEELLPHLEAEDIIIDGGNSLFTDTNRRSKYLKGKHIRFVGMGVSGGEEGALLGPSMMPGGDESAYKRIEPIVTKMAAQVDGEPCCAYIGPEGAGHYVKMVHNGIEYADMQLIAEAYDLFKSAYGLDAGAIAGIFEEWNKGELDSISSRSQPLCCVGATRRVSLLSTPFSMKPSKRERTLDRAVGARSRRATDLDHRSGLRSRAVGPSVAAHRREQTAHGPTVNPRRAGKPDIDAIRDALYASKIIAYAQGFEQLEAASQQFGWNLKLGRVASLWQAAASFAPASSGAFAKPMTLAKKSTIWCFRVTSATSRARRSRPAPVVALGIEQGVPTPASPHRSPILTVSGVSAAPRPVPGFRHYFGAHTYRRLDKPGSFRTRWAPGREEMSV